MSENHAHLTAACLFSGMGGFSEALSRAGFSVLWGNELDPHACKTYRANHPQVQMFEKNVRDLSVSADNLPPVAVLTAGFPCQSFSQAGRKGGFDDDRGRSFYEIPRILKEFGEERPAVVILENVPNLLGGGDGLWFDEIVEAVQEAGYWFTKNNSRIVNTADLTGIPQNRPRLFMVALSMSAFAGNTYRFPADELPTADVSQFINLRAKPSPDHYLPDDNRYYKLIDKAMKENGEKGFFQLRRYYARDNKNRLCPALTANMGVGGHNIPFVRDSIGIRRLTVAECLKLQGFSADYRFPAGMSDIKKYQQIGNSVTVPLAELIIEQVKVCIEHRRDLNASYDFLPSAKAAAAA